MKPLKLLLFLLLSASAFAQTPTKHTCRILFLNRPSTVPETLYLFDGATSREVELPGMNLSEVYELPAGPLTLSLLPAAVGDPEKLPIGAPSVKVAEGVRDFYLLVTSDPENKVTPVSMQVINASDGHLKRGQMLWHNLTENTIDGIVGSEELTIKPGSSEVLDPPASGIVDYPVHLSFKIPGDESTHRLCQTKWRHDPRSGSVVLVVVGKGGRNTRVVSFSDFRPDSPEKP